MPSGWDDIGPCELPDGRLVCAPHGLVICGRCTVDYSFMEANDPEEDERIRAMSAFDSFNALKRGTGRVFPTIFVPPSTTIKPTELFSGTMRHMAVSRYTLPHDTRTGLIHTDGACLDNGHENPRAGWGFWHGYNTASRELLTAEARVEKKGPFGDEITQSQTSNRAELRAVIAALRFRYWPGEGFHKLVIATDSEYVVEGCTNWSKTWVRKGWVKTSGSPVKNKDLWEALLGEIERFDAAGMSIQFWRIPREWNTIADAAAKEAATTDEAPEQWTEMMGMNF
ncbi:ribonuclease H-like domain-containing protein [Podospora conica]|nr:ribonuclease H-like domain-containing protein [Schizothecium conicum]